MFVFWSWSIPFLQISRNKIFSADPYADNCSYNGQQETGKHRCFKATPRERVKHGQVFYMGSCPKGRGNQRAENHAENSAKQHARKISNADSPCRASGLDGQRGGESTCHNS